MSVLSMCDLNLTLLFHAKLSCRVLIEWRHLGDVARSCCGLQASQDAGRTSDSLGAVKVVLFGGITPST
jgi:hypothetical protein